MSSKSVRLLIFTIFLEQKVFFLEQKVSPINVLVVKTEDSRPRSPEFDLRMLDGMLAEVAIMLKKNKGALKQKTIKKYLKFVGLFLLNKIFSFYEPSFSVHNSSNWSTFKSTFRQNS